jgi:IS30 family transposase
MSHYSRLTREQRYTLEAMKRNGASQKEIAAAIGKHPSTVSREFRRAGMTSEIYRFETAQEHADSREWKGRRVDPEIWSLVERKIRQEQWSPQQISRWLDKHSLGQVSHETIYLHIYRDKAAGGTLHAHFRHRCKSYRKRGSGRERRGRLKDQVMIDQRPSVVDDRSRVGDWEMDTVIGHLGGPVLVTMVERVSRYTLIALAATKEALVVGAAIIDTMYPQRDKVFTMTYDNGKEFAQHAQIAERLDANAYFAHPYHSWERGLNENTNGLIRQYFPKGSSFANLTAADISAVQDKLNSRPRKCLDYATPNAIFIAPPPIALAA